MNLLKGGTVLSQQELKYYTLLPLRGVLVFPYMVIHLDVGRKRSIAAIEAAMLKDNKIFLASQRDVKQDEPQAEDIFQVGTIAEIKQILKMPGGTMRVLVEGLYRASIKEFIVNEQYVQVAVEELPDPAEEGAELEALKRTLVLQFEQYVRLSKKVSADTVASVTSIQGSGHLADVIVSHLQLQLDEKQELLECVQLKQRLNRLCEILSREMEVLELERKINIRVRKQMEKTQKDYYLREQMKAIQKELGERDEHSSEIEELKAQIEAAGLPDYALEKANKELDRLSKMPPSTAEAVVVRNYLDWLLAMPWSAESRDRLDLDKAEQILEEDHYGLEKPKERILEYLAVRKLAKKMKGPILCLVGPPGVGKTSLGKSVARSLGRKFVRISLGGIRDEAEIRGHRRTYVGSMPGRVLQGMKQAGTRNPVFLLDEVDKMTSDFRGDPSSALLEVFDPEQNNSFSDHYMEIPFDLSRVLFITTANTTHNIPQALLDRMEVIEIGSYTEEDKVQIAVGYLIPKQIKEHGIKEDNLAFEEMAVRKIIRQYTREPGVRGLERRIASICRKVVLKVVKDKNYAVTVTEETVSDYLGIEKYHYGTAEEKSEIGVTTGLAWTEAGGDILSIEVALTKGRGKLTLTGKLGDVMKESAQAGLTYVRFRAEELGIKPETLENYDIHIHVPEGAIPKDGPSAGITMATSLASAMSGRPVKNTVAMTGEITLRGRVLPIGGLKEKSLAAHRAGIYTLIIPEENRKDVEEIPDNVREKLNMIYVSHMDEVLTAALENGGAP
ncbi:MAG: endopeptidase La [Syntrophomonadaceae bacterium]|nr:endopeptidase La [Syntrophomonadaceae bacterium]